MADDSPAPGPSLLQRMRPGRFGLAMLAAAIALLPPLLTPAAAPPAPRPTPARRAAPAAPAPSPVTLLTRLASRLASTETLHLAERSAAGALTLEIDTADPQALRARLAADPLFAGLATAAETIVPDAGLRVRLTRPGTPPAAAAPADPAALAEAARRHGLLVERTAPDLAVSGAEAAVVAFLADLARTAHGFGRWRIEQAGGAVRLSGMPVRLTAPTAAPPPPRRLFADSPPTEQPDAPVLVGIAGRLGRDAVALVRDTDGGVATVAVGATVAGWRLDTVSADAALFSRGGETVRIALPTADEPPAAEEP